MTTIQDEMRRIRDLAALAASHASTTTLGTLKLIESIAAEAIAAAGESTCGMARNGYSCACAKCSPHGLVLPVLSEPPRSTPNPPHAGPRYGQTFHEGEA